MNMLRKVLALSLVGCLFGTQLLNYDNSLAAAKLNKTSLSLGIGSTYTLKVSGTSSSVKWKSSNKSVAKVSKKGKVTAKKKGTATISAKVSGSKLKCKVTVKSSSGSSKGTKSKPLSAYADNKITYYEDGKKMGTFNIRLMSFLSGSEASKKVNAKNTTNPVPTDQQEYIYFKFQIKYLSGTKTVDAKHLFDYYHNIYDSTGKTSLKNIDWGFFFELVEDLSDISLSPGNKIVCSKAILVSKNNTPVLYKICTGKNKYTWFTTKK